MSIADFDKTPSESKSGLPGWVPEVSARPGVAFNPNTAARLAGWTTDPSVSAPRAKGANPAATPTQLPEEEPEGVYMDGQKIKSQTGELRTL
jgi:hypothetical protein